MASLIDCLVVTGFHWWSVGNGNLAVVVVVVCLEVMVRTKTTERMSAGVQSSPVQRHRRHRLLVNRLSLTPANRAVRGVACYQPA